MVPRKTPTRRKWTSLEQSSFHWLLPEPKVKRTLPVNPKVLMVLTQLQKLTRYATVTKRSQCSTLISYQPPKLSGNHLNSRNNQRVNSREPPNTDPKSRRLPKRRMLLPPKHLPPPELKMRRLSLIFKVLRLVQFSQSKSPTSSDRLRLPKEKHKPQRLSPKREPKSPLGNSNLMPRRSQLKESVTLPTKRVSKIRPDSIVTARE